MTELAVSDDRVFSVAGKVCLITGASTGLGAAFARALLARGACVVNLSRTAGGWIAEHPGGGDRLIDLRGDVRDGQRVAAAVEAGLDRFGRLDVLINNAGDFTVTKAARQQSEALAALFDVNLVAVAHACRLCHAHMRAAGQGGSIINVSSVLAHRPMKGLAGYGASKAALEHLTRSLALEWARDGVRVNNLAPGWFPTQMTEGYFEKGVGTVLAERIPMRRLGSNDDLTGALLMLASDASRYMTGTTITIDGGFSLAP